MIESNWTDEERRLLAVLPHTVGSAMAFAEHSGLIGTGKEMFATAQAMMAGLKDFPNNSLIKAVVPQLASGEDREAQMQRMTQMRDWSMARLKEKGVKSPDKFRELALADAREVNAMLAAKASTQEADEYRKWLMSVADRVANASTEGGFLGIGSTRISAGEAALIKDLQSALGVA
jgi:hypothetical protein